MYNKHIPIPKPKLSILTFLLFCISVASAQDNSSLYQHVDSLMHAELGFDYDSVSNIEKEVTVKEKQVSGEKDEAVGSGKKLICKASSTSSKSPLLILNGKPIKMNELNDHELSSIGEILVFKDAQAAALYGSRASYGVIFITSNSPDK